MKNIKEKYLVKNKKHRLKKLNNIKAAQRTIVKMIKILKIKT